MIHDDPSDPWYCQTCADKQCPGGDECESYCSVCDDGTGDAHSPHCPSYDGPGDAYYERQMENGGGNSQQDPDYRAAMRDAGRGHLLP